MRQAVFEEERADQAQCDAHGDQAVRVSEMQVEVYAAVVLEVPHEDCSYGSSEEIDLDYLMKTVRMVLVKKFM